MKTSIRYKAPTVLATLFFIGIVVSAYTLFKVAQIPAASFLIASLTIGSTFLCGIVSIYLLITSKTERIVYVEKSKQVESLKDEIVTADVGQLSINQIEKIVDGPYDSLQNALNEVCEQLQAGQGAIYLVDQQKLDLKYGYAISFDKELPTQFEFGEGLIGRVAAEKKMLCIDKLPDNYLTIFSGLGSASPSYLVMVPIVKANKIEGVLEVALFQSLNKSTLEQLKNVAEILAGVMRKDKMIEYA
jgi:putative methionine-R-sulfoxide reductase with GAF domain